MGTEEIKKDVDISKWLSELGYDQWVALPVSGPRPSARYKVFSLLKSNYFEQSKKKFVGLADSCVLYFYTIDVK